MFSRFNFDQIQLTQYLFFTGKGGVGKTSTACALAVGLADMGKKVMLVSTDPASNLQDVFDTPLTNKGVVIGKVPNLTVANFEPEVAAAAYREHVVGPYRGKLPESVIENMEEQLSGSCTVEIAAFNEFTHFITDATVSDTFDHVIFDTAPTGHTLRMLALPAAWHDFIDQNTTGASCLGQLSGLSAQKSVYADAVEVLADADQTTLMLVTRPQESPVHEALRASKELMNLGVHNQVLMINGVLNHPVDALSQTLYDRQQGVMATLDSFFEDMPKYEIPLKPFNLVGVEVLRNFFIETDFIPDTSETPIEACHTLEALIQDLHDNHKKVVFTMGKGGVGKTTMAAAIAQGLVKKGNKVHLTTTDPAAHIHLVTGADAGSKGLTVSHIDEKVVLEQYCETVLLAAKANGLDASELAYIEEDLRSPCTQEIAVFRAFAEVVNRSEEEIVVIDTAPTGHTLLLLDATQSYHKEIKRSSGDIPEAVRKLLPKLRDENHTEVIILTLPEATPVHEAVRLKADLERAGLHNKWWLVNESLLAADTTHPVLRQKAKGETKWIQQVQEISKGFTTLVRWMPQEVKGPILDLL